VKKCREFHLFNEKMCKKVENLIFSTKNVKKCGENSEKKHFDKNGPKIKLDSLPLPRTNLINF
jgi:hypothetical protein